MNGQSVLRLLLASATLAALSSVSLAQSAIDFPSLKGGNARLGRNGDVAGSYPGQAPLKWFYPAGSGTVSPITIDNTDAADARRVLPTNDTRYYYQSPYPRNIGGFSAASPKFLPNKGTYDASKEWVPSPVTGEATFTYKTAVRAANVVIGGTTYAPNYNSRRPAYSYTRCTASAVGKDPTIAADPANLRYFEWRFEGPVGTTRYYSVYANIPIDKTRYGSGPNDYIFPQRYYVYEIIYGSGQRFVDVVDTSASGGGFVRLGGGGKDTNAVFPFDGTTPIIVRLYNTVPRDAAGKLTTATSPNNYAVYADAVRGQPTVGYYTASPVAGTMSGSARRVVAALNQVSTDIGSDVTTSTRVRGVVTSYWHDFNRGILLGNVAWQYYPVADRTGEGSRDNESADTTHDANWFLGSNTRFLNGDYRYSTLTADPATLSRTTYAPTLVDGDYDIYAYLPGNAAGQLFGRSVRYEINEGGVRTLYSLNQSKSQGYVRIGTRRFKNVQTGGPAAPLSVSVTNYSDNAADTGRLSVADAILFVGQGNIAIDSTPVLATAKLKLNGGNNGTRSVVFTADESGRIHCLDGTGRGDTSTDVYWVYPSKRGTGIIDPNLSEGIDGKSVPAPSDDSVPTAIMPSGFGQSSGLVARINGQDYFYIASKNGRVYCLEVAGRGDFDTTTRTPGTTRRVWTWPDDFPSTPKPALTGGITGSLAYAVTAAGPTIFVTSNQGRIYALDAKPTALPMITGRKTTVRWAFPAETQPSLPKISMTPTIEFNKLYFGTQQSNEQYARFYALNIDTGLEEWRFPTDAQLGTASRYQTISWLAGPATATSGLVPGQANTVFCINQNRYLYALNADTGAEIWSTNELGVGSSANLGFTLMDVFDNSGNGTKIKAPVVLVPTDNNRFVALFARNGDINRQGTRRAWGFQGNASRTYSSLATALNWMYGADANGFLYAFSDQATGFSSDLLADAPGQQEIVENNPAGDLFRETRTAFISAATYRRLMLAQGDPGSGPGTGHPKYSDLFFDSGAQKGQLKPGIALDRNPYAFEWGETVYVLAYNFPFVNERTPRGSGNYSPPPQVNFNFSVEGNTARTLPAEARQLTSPTTAPLNTSDPQWQNDGYAVLAYTFQGGGPSALPPGNALVSASLTTSSLGNGIQQQIALNEALTTLSFQLANPLGVSMEVVDPTATNVVPLPAYSIGASIYPNNPQNLVNGSPDVTGAAPAGDSVAPYGKESHLLKSAGYAQHGAGKTLRVYVTDRSMMGLIRPDGQGLDNVRIDRGALVWQGSSGTLYKPLEPSLYPLFEDLPTSFPNRSLDYPDIRLENLRVTKDPNGNAENPVFATTGVTLAAPLIRDGSTLRPMTDGDSPTARVFRPTPFDFEINVPKYQPANTAQLAGGAFLSTSAVLTPTSGFANTVGAGPSQIPQGYIGRQAVFVDSSQNGLLDDDGREAFRSFVISTSVVADQRLSVSTPTVDPNSNQGLVNLGSLAGGFGYMLNPTTYSPWTGQFTSSFQPFEVLNEGNVNLKDVRVAKLSSLTGTLSPWAFTSTSSDNRAWLDGSLDLWSNFDTRFAPTYSGVSRQIIQKPRVGDTAPTTLVVNPSRRENANLGAVASPLINGPQSSPKVSVTVPFGFPVGTYSQLMRVIENEDGSGTDQTWNPLSGSSVESFSDPTFSLVFSVRESRLTNRSTRGTDVQIDNLTPDGSTAAFAYKSAQPSLMRTIGGGLTVAWASDRPADTPVPSTPTSANSNAAWRIYFASLKNNSTFSANSINTPGGAGYSAIRDLNFWSPATGQWFKKSPVSASGYPSPATDIAGLFGLGAGETIEPGSDRFYFPTLPSTGMIEGFHPSDLTFASTQGYLAFVGEVTKRSGGNATRLSRVFVAQFSIDAGGSITAIGNPIPVSLDSSTIKGRPSVFRNATDSVVIVYPETSQNGTSLVAVKVSGSTVGTPAGFAFGGGFTSVSELSLTGRYRGTNPMLEAVFTGQLKGSNVAEVFRGNSALLDAGVNLENGIPWNPLPYRVDEPLVSKGSGTYQAEGVSFDLRQNIAIRIRVGTDAPIDIVRPGTKQVNAETGVISFESTLGGRVFIDPTSGTVRFAGSVPGRNSTILLSYSPYFVRVSEGQSSYRNPVAMFDNRKTSDLTYWVPASLSNFALKNDRLVVMATRGGGNGQATRPVMKTMRLGIRLPAPILTADNGAVVSLAVSGNSGPYQVDPATGKVYFTTDDDGKAVTITYTAADAATGASLGSVTVSGTVDWVTELEEVQIPIEQAVNEGGFSAFIDPFDPASADDRLRRPALYWLIWSSTRGGVPDLYLQTIAPRLAPVPLGR